MRVGLSLAFPPDYVHAQRALGVGIGVLCQLDTEVPFQREALRWLTARAGAGPSAGASSAQPTGAPNQVGRWSSRSA